MTRLVKTAMATVAACILAGCAEQPKAIDPIVATRTYTDAQTTLLTAADDRDPVTRTQAMEALAQSMGDKAGGTFTGGLADADAMVRFGAAMAIGDTRYKPAETRLIEVVRNDPDFRVRAACVYALHQIGNDTYTHHLGELLYDQEDRVRKAAVMCMGKFGGKAAYKALKSVDQIEPEGADRLVKFQLTESLAILGDAAAIGRLEAQSRFPTVTQIDAIYALGLVGRWHTSTVLTALLNNRQMLPLARVAAAASQARLGEVDDAAYTMCLDAVRDPAQMARRAYGQERQIAPAEATALRHTGIVGLGLMRRTAAVDTLRPLLDNPDGTTRVAAALSVMRLLAAYAPQARGGLSAESPVASMPPASPRVTSPAPATSCPAPVVPATTTPATAPVATAPAASAPVTPALPPLPTEPASNPASGSAVMGLMTRPAQEAPKSLPPSEPAAGIAKPVLPPATAPAPAETMTPAIPAAPAARPALKSSGAKD